MRARLPSDEGLGFRVGLRHVEAERHVAHRGAARVVGECGLRVEGQRQDRRRAFFGKWAVERAIGYAMLAPALFDRAVERLERRGLAHTLIGVTGDFVPPRAVLNPVFLSQVVF